MPVSNRMMPFMRFGTDVIERLLTVIPYPQASITSTNCSQPLRFDFPPGTMLDCTQQGLKLQFTMRINRAANASVGSGKVMPFPGECMGHLVNTQRVFVNNEQVCLVWSMTS